MADQYSGGLLGYGAEYDRLAAELKRIQDDNESKVRVGAGWTINSADFMNRQMAITNRMDDIRSGRAAGNDAINSAISTAQQGIGVAGAGANAMRSDAASMRGQARLVNTQGSAVNRDADALAALVPQLDPYKAKLTNYGDELNALAASLQTRTDDVFGQAGALVNLDPNAKGLAGEYLAHYNLLSPDRYVSQGASDAQAAIQNQAGQMERDLSRRGVSASSGAFASLRQQAAQKAAQLVAATKTLMRQKGLDEQAAFLDKMTGAAKTFFDMGTTSQSQTLAAKTAAGDMAKSAAGIVTAQGGLIGDAGRLRATAGQLFGSAASIFGNAAGVEGSAANLELSALKNLQSAQQAAAQYYLNGSRQGGGGGGGGGGNGSSGGGEESHGPGWDPVTLTTTYDRNMGITDKRKK